MISTLSFNTNKSTVWSSLTSLFSWISTKSPIPNSVLVETVPERLTIDTNSADSDTLFDGWHWVLSSAEKVIQTQQTEVASEIESLRRIGGTVKYRPYLLNNIISLWGKLDPALADRLAKGRLDSSLRNSIFKDYLKGQGGQGGQGGHWFQIINQILNSRLRTQELIKPSLTIKEEIIKIKPLLKESWDESQYQKNVIGNIKVACLQASAAAETTGLNIRILVDIIWTISTYLSKILVNFTPLTNRSIHPTESYLILNNLLEGVPTLLELWGKTIEQTGTVNERIGKLPESWKIKENNKLIKPISARYNDLPEDPKRIDPDKFNDNKIILRNLLYKRYNIKSEDKEDKEEKEECNNISMGRDRFREVAKILESKLKKRS